MIPKDFQDYFNNPPKEYSPAPLWFWYGKLDKKELARQVDEMVDKGVYNAFMHPRAYLLTQYLEDEWWDVVSYVIEYSRKKGFHPWLYDEYAWPSGTAGSTFVYSSQKPSRVLAEGQCNMAKGLRCKSADVSGTHEYEAFLKAENEKPYALVIMKIDADGKILDESLKIIDADHVADFSPGEGSIRIMAFHRYIIPTAVDYLNKKTIETFVKLTHEEYKKRFGKYFGTLIPGIFFDEIFNAADKIVWTDAFSEEFLLRKGYDIKKYLPLLVSDGGKMTAKVRKDYYSVVAALYEEAFFDAIGNWCDENNLLLTGHTEEDLKQHPLRQGDYFKTMRHLHIPGGDCHDYRYKYPRKITPIEPKGAVSVGRLNNRSRIMSEAMGGGGWATSLQEFKRGVNVLAAMGINFFVLHGFYSETDHQGSQADWPASFFFQNPYWKNFKVFADYIGRLSFMGTYGKPVVKVGLLYPVSLIYERFQDGKSTADGERLADIYNTALETLLNNQIDTDVIDEESIKKAAIASGKLTAGKEEFEVLVIPDTEGLDSDTVQKLLDFEKNGGYIIFYDCPAKNKVNGNFRSGKTVRDIAAELPAAVKALIVPDFEIISGDNQDIYYYHRTSRDMDYYLLVNACDKERKVIARFSSKGRPRLFNIETGEYSALNNWTSQDGSAEIDLTLREDEAFFVVFSGEDSMQSDYVLNMDSSKTITLMDNWTIIPVQESPGEFDSLQDGTEVKLPAAMLSSDVDPSGKFIRIQNREGEKGSCGRHLSLWRASWITRRPSWSDESCEKSLYFRKVFYVEKEVKAAAICIAAVNFFELYVNGIKVFSGEGWRKPDELEIGKHLKRGRNLIAVKVSNTTPVQGKNMLETEHFNPDTLTSLLMEGYVQTEDGIVSLNTDKFWIVCSDFNAGWETLELKAEETASEINIKGITFPWGLENRNSWIYAWERGTPPIQPWGALPLFGRDVDFPVNLKYEIHLPSGTKKVLFPAVSGDFSLALDGRKIAAHEYDKGFVEIEDISAEHDLLVNVKAENFEDGLKESVRIIMTEQESSLGDWRKMGLPFYSGSMLYKTDVDIDKYNPSYKYELDLGRVNFHAEVWVNGKRAGVKLWKPYKLDISDHILPGRNTINIVISNLVANKMRISLLDEGFALGWNRYWYEENIDRDAQNLVSGLLGPVKIIVTSAEDIKI